MKGRAALGKLPLLCVEGVSKRFGGVKALEDISFSVERGRVVGLIGPNGAGKTTLFNCLTGLAPADSGALLFGDSQIVLNRMQPDAIAARGIARTFQMIRLFKHMNALENVLVGAHVRSTAGVWGALWRPRWVEVEEKKMAAHAMRLLDFFGLSAKAHELAGNLSYGHQRLLEIARALASEPQLLLLDEPAAGLNPKEKGGLLEMIAAIRSRGVTILLIEHDMKVVMPISEHVVVLDYGKKIAEGTPAQVQNHPRVIEAYLGSGHHA